MIFLVQINYTKDRSEAILPLGILSVGSSLKRNGFEVELLNINEKEINQTVEYILEKNPLYVGFSVMTGIQTEHSAEMSKKIKEKSDIPVLWGGIHPSLLPQQCLQSEYIDYVIIGEGEEAIIEFSKAIEEKFSFEGILGLGYKIKDGIIINPRRPLIEDLDNYRLDFSLIDLSQCVFKLDKYQRAIAYKASRGCPFDCAFCYNHDFNQNRWRTWSVGAVIEDIEFLKEKYQIDAVKFYDDNFFVDKKRALEILEKINLPSHTELRIDAIDDFLAEKLKKLGSFDLLIGMESGSDRLLKMIDKNINTEDIIKAAKILSRNNLRATYSAIVGLPTETKEEFDSTINLMYQVHKIHPQAGFTLGAYLPYPGSKLYQFSLKHGFNPPEKTEDWGKIDRFRNRFVSPWINARLVWKIREYFKFLSINLGLINKWLEFRIKRKFFSFPVDIYLLEYFSDIAIKEKGLLGKSLRKVHNLMKK
ncbi:B12-binding domain-containing radical SAM protein [Patescibacteria group bacterium]|nr:B12-binding domain-containing radical SAM protein [Patescibacteria group bacterium]